MLKSKSYFHEKNIKTAYLLETNFCKVLSFTVYSHGEGHYCSMIGACEATYLDHMEYMVCPLKSSGLTQKLSWNMKLVWNCCSQ